MSSSGSANPTQDLDHDLTISYRMKQNAPRVTGSVS